jgi:aspartyl protease family protein
MPVVRLRRIFQRCGEVMRQIVIMAGALLVFGVLAVKFIDHGATRTPNAATAMTSQPASPPGSPRNVVLRRGNGGHFWTDARIDGRRLEFVVDTGASAIALRESDAARLGIRPAPRDYTVKVNTANGISRAAPVLLQRVEIGDIVVRDVPALVHPDSGLSINLLGTTFLSKVRWTHDRGKLVLEQ